MNISTELPRRHDLDALRTVVMLLVIAFHVASAFFPTGWPVQDSRQHIGFGLLVLVIHGFQMPMFFILGGFFCTMMWRRRGFRYMLWHRFRRIFLPLLLGLFTIVPAVYWVNGIASESALSREEAARADIWAAAKMGDRSAIEQHLARGADVNEQDSTFKLTPLSWAALADNEDAVDALIQNGAHVNAKNGREGGTPLHLAALFGNTQTIALLIQNGADVNVRDSRGETALDSTMLDIKLTRSWATTLQIEFDDETVMDNKLNAAEFLRQRGAEAEQATFAKIKRGHDERAMLMYRLMYVPVFAHLWFLWLFSWLVVGFAIIAMIVERLPAIKLPSVLVLSPARYVWLIPLTMIPQSFMGFQGRIPSVGPDTSQGILPMPHVLAYYALFFGFGALYASYDDKVGRISKRWRFALPIGLLVIFPLGLEFSTGAFGLRDKLLADELHRLLSIFFQAIYPWTLTFALMGLIRHFFSKASKTMRYLSDSSYWMYLTHMPLVTAAQIAVCEWPMPAIIKFTLIFVVICAFLLWTYQTLVRYTWLGTFLNGPRKRPVKTVAQGELVKRRA